LFLKALPLLPRYWHTVRHLRPVQFYGRLWFRFARPRPDLRPAPTLRKIRAGAWVLPARRDASLLGEQTFRFLNQTRELRTHGWDDPGLEKLWRYNLHYFDDLNAHAAERRIDWHRDLLTLWVRENSPCSGTGWEPYPTSLRIVNWIKWALRGNHLPQECAQSLAVQARWLSKRLEIHLLGNHLFANAKALVFAGMFFDGEEARRWLEKGLTILEREVPQQILTDGGQFELSPMYHALALEDMLDLCNLANLCLEALPAKWQGAPRLWRSMVEPMQRWLATMCHPDGEIAFFNDAAIGIAPAPTELRRYAGELGLAAPLPEWPEVTHLDATGYLRVQSGPMIALLDAAAVGPDYLPGHAHADTLSFECNLFGQRLFVNAGTYCYGDGVERQRLRGTAAHNTVSIDGENSSEIWAGFRVARRAYASRPVIERSDHCTIVKSEHSGYLRLPGKNIHQRQWVFGAHSLSIEDRVIGPFRSAEARFLLHPGVRVDGSACHAGRAVLTLQGGEQVEFLAEQGRLSVEEASWHPEFGKSLPTACLVVRFLSPVSQSRINW
jgi:uncharacterized heparinase superfamily protein